MSMIAQHLRNTMDIKTMDSRDNMYIYIIYNYYLYTVYCIFHDIYTVLVYNYYCNCSSLIPVDSNMSSFEVDESTNTTTIGIYMFVTVYDVCVLINYYKIYILLLVDADLCQLNATGYFYIGAFYLDKCFRLAYGK